MVHVSYSETTHAAGSTVANEPRFRGLVAAKIILRIPTDCYRRHVYLPYNNDEQSVSIESPREAVISPYVGARWLLDRLTLVVNLIHIE